MEGLFINQPLDDFFKEETATQEITPKQLFIDFICQLEGWKTKCKNLHWSAPKKNIHEDLDDFLSVISDYQDGLAEDYQGTLGKMQPNAIKGTPCECLNAIDFIREVAAKTKEFYAKIADDVDYVGIKSETETFIHQIKVYTYKFGLCDVRPY